MSDYIRKYTNGINWQNYTNITTPLSASNLNGMVQGINDVDAEAARAIATKADKDETKYHVKGVSFDDDTGIFTFTLQDNSTITIDTALEKVVTNFVYNYQTEMLVLTLADGTTQNVDLSKLITQYEFVDSPHIAWILGTGSGGRNKLQITASGSTVNGITYTVNSDGTVTANGTATADSEFALSAAFTTTAQSVLSGCPSGGGASTYSITFGTSYSDTGSSVTIAASKSGTPKILIKSGVTVSNLVFKPMISLKTDYDSSPDFIPYLKSGEVYAILKKGSITGDYLQPDYLADVTGQKSLAIAAATLAESYAHGGTNTRTGENTDNAMAYARDSEAWAVGKRNGADVGSSDSTYHNNSKYYAHQAEVAAEQAAQAAGNRNFYGTCSTAAATAEKAVVVTDSSFDLVAGAEIYVKFTNTNTASNPTVNVNGTGAKSVWFGNAKLTTSNLNKAGRASYYQKYVYDGTYWVWAGQSVDDNITYSNMSVAEFQTGTATTQRAPSAANLKAAVNSYDTAFGTCSTAADQQVKVVTIADSNWQLRVGGIIGVKFTNTNTYSATASAPVKLNVNNSGEKQIYYSNSAAPTGTNTTAFGTAATINYYMYDGTYWVWLGHSTDSNTTYTNVRLGQGYATCSTAAATAAKTATLSSYELTAGGVVAVKFTYAVPANATLSINSKTAKAIYYKGAAITAGVINAGDIAVFMYNGSQYVLLGIDYDARRAIAEVVADMPHYKDVTISATASTGTVGGMDYTHTQTVSWTGMTANDEVRLYITGGTYDDDIAVDSQSGQCVIYFGSEPTTLTSVRLVANAVYA